MILGSRPGTPWHLHRHEGTRLAVRMLEVFR